MPDWLILIMPEVGDRVSPSHFDFFPQGLYIQLQHPAAITTHCLFVLALSLLVNLTSSPLLLWLHQTIWWWEGIEHCHCRLSIASQFSNSQLKVGWWPLLLLHHISGLEGPWLHLLWCRLGQQPMLSLADWLLHYWPSAGTGSSNRSCSTGFSIHTPSPIFLKASFIFALDSLYSTTANFTSAYTPGRTMGFTPLRGMSFPQRDSKSLNISNLQSREGVPCSVLPCIVLITSIVSSPVSQLMLKLGAFPGSRLSGLLMPLSMGLLRM